MSRPVNTVLLLLLLMPALVSAKPDILGRVERLSSQAPGLALHYLESVQATWRGVPETWMALEKLRYNLYWQQKRYDRIVARYPSLPDKLPPGFYHWAMTERIRALIRLQKYPQVLVELRQQLWKPYQAVPVDAFRHWRRLVIEVYLLSGRVDDAVTAMRRYQNDYRQTDVDWTRLQARVLLKAGRAAEAGQLMSGAKTALDFALYFQARLETGSLPPIKIYWRTRKMSASKRVPAPGRYRLQVVAARAAEKEGKFQLAIGAYQHALLISEPEASKGSLFYINEQQLWKLYTGFGKSLANSLQLLIGNDEAWISQARKLEKKKPVQARALYAALSEITQDRQVRQQAMESFALSLAKSSRQWPLLYRLFVHSGIASVNDLPLKLRHKMIDKAIKRSDFRSASALMASLTEPPRGAKKLYWQLLRARILILGGKHQQAVSAVEQVLAENKSFDQKQMDRLMQVLFDLQTIGKHEAVLPLFKKLPVGKDDVQRRREVLFWQADSYKAMGQYMNAARLYMQSAILEETDAMDPWAQTARYHSAEMLAKAGQYDDARRIFRALLRVTKDGSRRTALRNKLQQLRLQQGQVQP